MKNRTCGAKNKVVLDDDLWTQQPRWHVIKLSLYMILASGGRSTGWEHSDYKHVHFVDECFFPTYIVIIKHMNLFDVRIFIDICTYACNCMYMYIYIHTYIHIYIYIHIHIYISTYIHIHLYTHTHIPIYLYIVIYIYMRVYIYIYVYVYVFYTTISYIMQHTIILYTCQEFLWDFMSNQAMLRRCPTDQNVYIYIYVYHIYIYMYIIYISMYIYISISIYIYICIYRYIDTHYIIYTDWQTHPYLRKFLISRHV